MVSCYTQAAREESERVRDEKSVLISFLSPTSPQDSEIIRVLDIERGLEIIPKLVCYV